MPMKRYDPASIEPKWQQQWANDHRYDVVEDSAKNKYYISCMFPYPSGAGMHTGHAFEHAIVDSVARFHRQQGYNVLNPMGWDAFGLPAENYAIKTGKPPAETTRYNIASFKNQLVRMGASLDWSREINTSDPSYYKWTQWIFAEFFKRGLAYQKESMQWWCPVDKTVLANEQVIDGKCWRCENEVVKKSMKQWFFKITDYAEALLEELPALNWPDKIKTAQENWIGKSQGAEITFSVEKTKAQLTVFSTRPDTVFGATFLVLAPEHPLALELTNADTYEVVKSYIDASLKRSEIERMSEGKEKTGVPTGSYAINPANGERIPIWVADYVLWGYGTGAIMAVPAHDTRDYEFASKFDLPIVQVIAESLYDQENPPQKGKQDTDRNVVMCIIEHPTNGEYLTLKWNKLPWHGFVMGGVEDSETAEEAARREIAEETGYTDMTFIEAMPAKINSKFYAAHKDVNRNILTTVVRFRLNSLDSVELQREAHEDFEPIWVKKDVLPTLKPVSELQHILRWLEGEKNLFANEGVLVHSGIFDGMTSYEAREQVVAWLEQQGIGRAKITYKMRDWLVSRQRYWGAPIPIIHCEKDGAVAVPADELPVLLPPVEDHAPKGDGKSVLARETDWVNTTCPACGGPAQRETDTMDGYACSSWYLFRYTDPLNEHAPWSKEKADFWAPLDMYVGGDHAVAHLLYVRFWTHVFRDMGLVEFDEPVKQLVYHGLIGAEDGRKMSKSLGNVVDPLDVIDQGYGADALRVFCLFLGPINENSSWSSRGIAGIYRFLNRTWTLTQEYLESDHEGTSAQATAVRSLTHRTIRKVTDDYRRLSFNTAIAALMEYVNELYKYKLDGFAGPEWAEAVDALARLIAPMAPHLGAELWQQLGNESSLEESGWPAWNDEYLVSDTMTIVVQVNGKVRAKLTVGVDKDEAEITALALADHAVAGYLSGEPKKIIYIKHKLLSIVV